MFAALASILSSNQTLDLSITLVADGSMKVIVKPQLVKGSSVSLAIPLALAATPQELDADFVGSLMQYAGERTSLQQQVDVTATIIAEAKASEVGKATKAIKASSQPAAKSASGTGEDGEGDDTLDGDDILEGAPTAGGNAIAPAAPAEQRVRAPAANSHDDLLSLMS